MKVVIEIPKCVKKEWTLRAKSEGKTLEKWIVEKVLKSTTNDL